MIMQIFDISWQQSSSFADRWNESTDLLCTTLRSFIKREWATLLMIHQENSTMRKILMQTKESSLVI